MHAMFQVIDLLVRLLQCPLQGAIDQTHLTKVFKGAYDVLYTYMIGNSRKNALYFAKYIDFFQTQITVKVVRFWLPGNVLGGIWMILTKIKFLINFCCHLIDLRNLKIAVILRVNYSMEAFTCTVYIDLLFSFAEMIQFLAVPISSEMIHSCM